MKQLYEYKVALIFLFSLFISQQMWGADKDFELIRKRVITEVLDQKISPERIKELINTIKPDGTWPGIDYIDTAKTAFQHSRHLDNLVQLSRAYTAPGSSFKGNKQVKNAIYSSLDYWTAHNFICENWWWNEIGTPNALLQVLLMMDKQLSKEQVDKTLAIVKRSHLNAWGARESGDRIKIGGIQAKTALFTYNIADFEYVIKVIEGQIRFVTGRGLQYDYSFHHRDDRVNNTLSYGLGYADAFAEWAYYTKETKYQLAEKPLHLLIDYYLDGICKMMPYGKYPDPGAVNRDVSRSGSLGVFSATTPQILVEVSDYRKNELEQIVKNRQGKELKAPSYSVFFWDSEYYTHQRPGYFTSVRMFSNRNANMEYPYNGEGLLNHYRGDGTNYISRTGQEYYQTAPVYDWQKIPGTTIWQKDSLIPETDLQKYGTFDFVGAVTDGLYGAVAFDFTSPHDPLQIKKSWFFFDKEYVCLGAGISFSNKKMAATTLNQCLLNGNVIVSSDDKENMVNFGKHSISNAKWVFHDSIGYFFPKQTPVELMNGPVTGNWRRINRQSGISGKSITENMFKLWINHDNQKNQEKGYCYVVIPAVSLADLKNYAASPEVAVLSNTADIQAVVNKKLKIYQVVCYKNGELQLTKDLKLVMDSPGIIMLKMDGSNITEISVSDPSRRFGKIHFSLNRKIEKQGELFDAVWNSSKNVSEISIDLPQTVYAGKSITVKL